MTRWTRMVASLALMAAVPAAAQAPADPPGLMGLDATTTKLLADSYAAARSPELEQARTIARMAKMQALARDPIDLMAYVQAVETERALSRTLMDRELEAELDVMLKLTPAQRKAVAAAADRVRKAFEDMRAAQTAGKRP